MKIIIGLGNPGEKYEHTRHNMGFRVLDLLAEQAHVDFVKSRNYKSFVTKGEIADQSVMLMKPQTYMNSSGDAVRLIYDGTYIPLEHFLVVCDDFQLPHGKLRIRRMGSSGGHNGLQSIIDRLGSNKFARLRLGLGAPAVDDYRKFVLNRFTKAEEKQNKEILDRAVEAVQCWLADGVDKCMTRFN
jgi:PTH1 family peptidyl-tRNA hydrolase